MATASQNSSSPQFNLILSILHETFTYESLVSKLPEARQAYVEAVEKRRQCERELETLMEKFGRYGVGERPFQELLTTSISQGAAAQAHLAIAGPSSPRPSQDSDTTRMIVDDGDAQGEQDRCAAVNAELAAFGQNPQFLAMGHRPQDLFVPQHIISGGPSSLSSFSSLQTSIILASIRQHSLSLELKRYRDDAELVRGIVELAEGECWKKGEILVRNVLDLVLDWNSSRG